jgi:hypothetical protein
MLVWIKDSYAVKRFRISSVASNISGDPDRLIRSGTRTSDLRTHWH